MTEKISVRQGMHFHLLQMNAYDYLSLSDQLHKVFMLLKEESTFQLDQSSCLNLVS